MRDDNNTGVLANPHKHSYSSFSFVSTEFCPFDLFTHLCMPHTLLHTHTHTHTDTWSHNILLTRLLKEKMERKTQTRKTDYEYEGMACPIGDKNCITNCEITEL